MALRSKRCALAALALAALTGSALAQQAAPAMPQREAIEQVVRAMPQREAIEQVVRDYLMKNPEIIRDAMLELEKRQQEEQKTAQRDSLERERAAILNSPRNIVVGNPSGDTTLVEFFDYNCGYCKRSLADLRVIIKSDPKLRVVLRDFPVLGPDSVEASRVALAAKQQLQGDKLFEFHIRLLESRGRVNAERALAVAKEMGLDIARIQSAIQSDEVRTAIQENVDLGDKLGLTGTPAFIIGDEIISGAVGVEPMRQALAAVRKCGKATC